MTIKQIIKESGMRQNYIAEGMDMSEQTLSNKVNGRRLFTRQELQKFAEITQMPLRVVERAARQVRE